MTDAAQNKLSPERLEYVPYWSIVWGQLRKDPIAVVGAWAIAALFLVAIYAPVICLDKPFVLIADGPVRFPWFGYLFNRLYFENSVDIFFNLLLLLLPVYALGVWFAARRLRGRPRWTGARLFWIAMAVHFVLFAVVAPESHLGLADNPLHYSFASEDFDELSKDAAAVFPPLRHSFRDADPAQSVKGPSRAHWLGTDREGRDVLARMIYGTRISLTIGVVAVSIYVAIGVFFGALAGYFLGWVDVVISRVIEIMICFPTFFLILTLVAFVEQRSIFHIMIIIGVTGWSGVARLVRAEFLKHRKLEYAQAARALGIPRWRIIFGHILPNAMAPVLVAATFGVASAILVESSLSFLGLGDVSAPSWGALLNSGRLERKLWLILAPGFMIFTVVSVFNLVGEGLRDALDPKLRR